MFAHRIDQGGEGRGGEARRCPRITHANGNFQFWDPVSHIQFSGDLGVSIASSADAAQTITS